MAGEKIPINNNIARVKVSSGIGTVTIEIQQLQVTAKVSRKNVNVEPHIAGLFDPEADGGFEAGCELPEFIFVGGSLVANSLPLFQGQDEINRGRI